MAKTLKKHSLLNLKDKFLKHKKAVVAIASGLLLALFVFRAPEMHKSLMRNYVGSKVFMITNEAENSGGTGFYVEAPSGKTFILTNAHVCNLDNKKLFAHLGGRKIKLNIVEISHFTDLCLLEQPGEEVGLSVGSKLEPGDQLEILGFPRLFPLTSTMGEYVGVTENVFIPFDVGSCPAELEGPKTEKEGEIGFGIVVQLCGFEIPFVGITTVKTMGGNSGSPVVNWRGRVVGVLFAGIQDNFDSLIIPLQSVQLFLKPY